MTEFGSPSRPDAVARVERIVSAAMERFQEMYPAYRAQVPRALGSTEARPDEEFAEYVAMGDDPQAHVTFIQSLKEQFGDAGALEQYIDFVERNERRLNTVREKQKLPSGMRDLPLEAPAPESFTDGNQPLI